MSSRQFISQLGVILLYTLHCCIILLFYGLSLGNFRGHGTRGPERDAYLRCSTQLIEVSSTKKKNK